MKRNITEFKLWVICIDEETFKNISLLNLDNIHPLNFENFKDDLLKKLQHQRTIAEYCWTITPIAPKIVFSIEKSIDQVTYIDCDLWFRKNPFAIFNEFSDSNRDVLITKHAFAPELDISYLTGEFCVQFLTFKNQASENIRSSWEGQCLDWCFNRFEDGKFGDQKYLDEWPIKFSSQIHILQQESQILGPWNHSRFPFSDASVWHFHGTRLLKLGKSIFLDFGGSNIPKPAFENVYLKYAKDIKSSLITLKEHDISFSSQINYTSLSNIKYQITHFLKHKKLLRRVKIL